ncbi:hypothetical protein Tco_0414994 [Tanacetum coccineum]
MLKGVYQNFAKKDSPCAKRNLVPRAVLMKYGLVSVNTARQGNPQMDLQDQGVIDSGCLMALGQEHVHLTTYEEVDGDMLLLENQRRG